MIFHNQWGPCHTSAICKPKYLHFQWFISNSCWPPKWNNWCRFLTNNSISGAIPGWILNSNQNLSVSSAFLPFRDFILFMFWITTKGKSDNANVTIAAMCHITISLALPLVVVSSLVCKIICNSCFFICENLSLMWMIIPNIFHYGAGTLWPAIHPRTATRKQL